MPQRGPRPAYLRTRTNGLQFAGSHGPQASMAHCGKEFAMDDQQKTFLLLALMIAILFCAGRAHAEAAAPVMDPGAATALVASEDQSSKQQAAMHEIGSAA